MTGLRPLPVQAGAGVGDVLDALTAMLDGGAALLPYAADARPPLVPDLAGDLPDDVGLVVATSGSSGAIKLSMLTRANLTASASATREVLGGPGTWLLAMPAHHIAGIQVLVRSIQAGTTPGVLDLASGFTVDAFAAATGRLATRQAGCRYTALVPTQLTRLLDSPAGRAALAGYDAVLVGGAATPPGTLAAARSAGVRMVRTYGTSETAGGCVYDGVPFARTEIHIDNDHHVVVGGSTVALGDLGQPRETADAFTADADGTRWFRTDDLGRLDVGGRLVISGRADDLINTGGLKVAPGPVEDAIVRYVPGVRDAVVVGSRHPTWGQSVSAAVTLLDGAPRLTVRDLRSALRGILPDHSLPQRLAVLDVMPLRGPGKPDRRALVAAFDETLEADVGRTL